MSISHGPTTLDLHEACANLAADAGELLVRTRAAYAGPDAQGLKDLGDQVSHEFLLAAINERFPGIPVLSEEGHDTTDRLHAERVFIVDPLDGTREFGERPRDDWAVHVAIWERGRLVAGAVALPARQVTYATGAGRRLPGRQPGPLRLAVSRSRPPALVTDLADRFEAELVPMGSAGVKAMAVVDGSVDAYVHAGGQYEWDSAAPVAVAAAYGLVTTREDGSALAYNQPDPYLPGVLIARPEVAVELQHSIDRIS
ncbi:MAG: 3'(2'),5'-bisphosphate nucleotidase CysQ [Nostocoides sp.]